MWKRLTSFAAALAVVFFGAVALGGAVDPDRTESETAGHGAGGEGGGHTVRAESFALDLRGGAFAVRRADGHVQRSFDVAHEQRMHLIAVRRDLAVFRHVHPEQRPDGSWTLPVGLDAPGSYRVIADFEVDGAKHTPSADLQVDGRTRTVPLPAPSDRASAGGLEAAMTRDGESFSFAVSRDGEPVAVQDYLGARGHLVALRASDLEYIHAHADADELRFDAHLPTTGAYRLFLQVQVDGQVHTFPFTVIE